MKAALLAIVLLSAVCASGQEEPGLKALEKVQRENDRAAAEAEKASEHAQQQLQQMGNNQQDSGPSIALTCTPKFSVKAGKVALGTKISITCSTRGAVIYYNTNGWTPTTGSRRYTNPIPISATTNLQAFAVAPNMGHSYLAQANYTVKGAVPSIPPLTLSPDAIVHAGTRLHLVTNTTISSKAAKVGDKLNLSLDQDIKVGDTVLAPKGTQVDATFTAVDPPRAFGTPGNLVFTVNSLTVHGKQIPLKGGETLQAQTRTTSIVLLSVFVPVVGLSSVAIHGHDAEIKPGMVLTASVTTDTQLQY
jgi:hypothetical protein